jgi:hypothetical protein
MQQPPLEQSTLQQPPLEQSTMQQPPLEQSTLQQPPLEQSIMQPPPLQKPFLYQLCMHYGQIGANQKRGFFFVFSRYTYCMNKKDSE